MNFPIVGSIEVQLILLPWSIFAEGYKQRAKCDGYFFLHNTLGEKKYNDLTLTGFICFIAPKQAVYSLFLIENSHCHNVYRGPSVNHSRRQTPVN